MSAQGTLGPLLIDIEGTELTDEDRQLLQNPWVGGVILFSRNFNHIEQLRHLVNEIKTLRTPRLLVTTDQEGGRVQRIKEPLVELPAMADLGHYYDMAPTRALSVSKSLGWLMAAELLALGIDMSFAPVLDLDYGKSDVIGSRSFHSDPICVAKLAGAWIDGMHAAGMQATGKHFPGHGCVVADTHDESALSEHSLSALEGHDIKPFMMLREKLAAVMTAHIAYSQVDAAPVTYSSRWLKSYLKQDNQYTGVIVSDDLAMQAAVEFESDIGKRVHLALDAGCDLLLVCNNRSAVNAIVSSPLEKKQDWQSKIATLYGESAEESAYKQLPLWQEAQSALREMDRVISNRHASKAEMRA